MDTEQELQPVRTRADARPRIDAGIALIALLGLAMVLQLVWILGRAVGA